MDKRKLFDLMAEKGLTQAELADKATCHGYLYGQ